MTTIKLDPGAALLLDALHGAGHAAYAVGGCVRDSLLGLDPHDWDLCTSARPEQVMALFGAEKCIPTGLQHGTVTVKQGGRFYETTTFRTEGAYSDGRITGGLRWSIHHARLPLISAHRVGAPFSARSMGKPSA